MRKDQPYEPKLLIRLDLHALFPSGAPPALFFLPEQLLPRDRTRQNIDFAYNWGARGENGMELVMEQEAPAGEVCLTPEAMDAYLDTLRQQGRSADTLAAYRRSIYGLYRSLPAGQAGRPPGRWTAGGRRWRTRGIFPGLSMCGWRRPTA